MLSKEELEARANELVADMRTWCRDQAPLWRQVPYLALQADGKDGYSDDRAVCYWYGWWNITQRTPRGEYNLCSVDCATGELANQYASAAQEQLVLARDEDISPLLFRLDELDAERVITALKERADRPVHEFVAHMNPEWPSEQADLSARFGLAADRPYVRPPWQVKAFLNGS